MGNLTLFENDLIIGEVSEWLKEHAWKACVRLRVPRVRISPSPHFLLRRISLEKKTLLHGVIVDLINY